MRRALSIAVLIFRRMLRDRQAIFFIFLLPFVIILVIGSATKNLASNAFPVGLVNGSSGALTNDLVFSLEHTKGIRIHAVANENNLRKDMRRGLYAGGVVIPPSYESDARSGRAIAVTFVADQARPPVVVRESVDAAVAHTGSILQAANFANARTHHGLSVSLSAAQNAARATPPVGVQIETVGHAKQRRFIVSGFEYTAPSQLVLFVFLTSVAASGFVIADRHQGIIRRLYAGPARASTVIAGYTMGRFVNAAFQAVYIVAIGTFVFGVHFGQPVAAFALITLFVLVSTAFAMLAGTVFRTAEQAGSLVPPLGIAMAMLSGCMWPRFIMPVPMQRLGQLFPQSWAMDAFIKLIAQGSGLRAILPQLAVLAAYAVVLFPIATWRLRRSIVA